MGNKIEISVSGGTGVGKSTIATLMQRYLKTLGFNVTITLTDHEMPPCPTELRKKTTAILTKGINIDINEVQSTKVESTD